MEQERVELTKQQRVKEIQHRASVLVSLGDLRDAAEEIASWDQGPEDERERVWSKLGGRTDLLALIGEVDEAVACVVAELCELGAVDAVRK
jgi:hypothetical protein